MTVKFPGSINMTHHFIHAFRAKNLFVAFGAKFVWITDKGRQAYGVIFMQMRQKHVLQVINIKDRSKINRILSKRGMA